MSNAPGLYSILKRDDQGDLDATHGKEKVSCAVLPNFPDSNIETNV